jgi:RHS repeat-associated protein
MSSHEKKGSNGASSSNGGLLPESLLDSASLGAPLDDNSPLSELHKAFKSSSGFDPISEELERLEKSNSKASNQDSNQNEAITYTPGVSNIFDPSQSLFQIPLAASNKSKNSNPAKGFDPLTGNNTSTELVNTNAPNFLTGTKSSSQTQLSTSQTNHLPFAIRSGGTLTINGNSDFDGIPTDLTDDALIYAGKGFIINGNQILPVQRDANGNPILDASGKQILVDKAVAVAPGYTTSIANGSSNKYTGLIPPQVVEQQTINVPVYADIKQLELARTIPAGTSTITFNVQQNRINNANDWAKKFPPSGTPTLPTVVRVTGGGLNIPANVTLNNYVITVDQGDINFNGSNHNFNNVVLIANNGNINLSNVQARDLSALASGSINMNGGARFAGSTLLANGSSTGNIIFNGATATTNTSDTLKVFSSGSITYNGATHTRGLFLSAKDFTFNGNSTLYGSISAKGNITFNGKATVIGVTDLMPDITPPVITASLARDTAPFGQTNTDKITFDPTISGIIADTSPLVEFRAGFNHTGVANFTNVLAQRNSDGSFTFTRAQLEAIYGGTLSDGTYTLHLQAKDLYGNYSNVFDFTFTLDTTTPVPSNLDLSSSNDSGISNTDNITNQNTPTITGNAEAGAVVQLFDQGQFVGQTRANNNGTWLLVTNSLTDGTYNLTATATDIAANVSSASNPLQVVIDTVAPDAPRNLKLTSATDTGVSNSDNITKNATPTIQGNAEAGTTVRLFKDGQLLGQTTATEAGEWQLQVGQLSDGQHVFTASCEDVAGNVSVLSHQLTVTVDTQVAPPSNLDLLAQSDSGSSNSDNLTNKITPSIAGNADVGSTVELFSDGQFVGKTTTGDGGRWQIVTNNLTDGVHNLTAIASDVAGNVSTVSASLQITVDSALPQLTLFTEVETAPITIGTRLVGSIDGTLSAVTTLVYHFDNLAPVAVSYSNTGAFDQELDLTGLTNGLHTLTITAIDTAGNISTTPYNVRVIIDKDPPVITASLLRDTAPDGHTNTDGITFDPTISGTVTDASRVTQFRASFDNTAGANFVNVLAQRNASGSFTFDRAQLETLNGGTLADGVYTLYLQAADEYDNLSEVFGLTFTLDTTVETPTFNLEPASDSPEVGDKKTVFDTVTLVGQTEANATVVLEQTGLATTADHTGQFSFANVPLAIGDNSFTARATDIAGNENTFSTTIYRLSAPTAINLTGNTVTENSATATVIGQLSTADPDVGDSHIYTLVDDAAGRFRIVGNQVQVANPTLLDFETNSQHSIIVRSIDASGLNKTEIFTISVTNVNEAPSFTTNPILNPEFNSPYTYNIVTSDPDAGDTRTIIATDLPSWLAFTNNGNGTATLSGTPNKIPDAPYNITLTVKDVGGLTASQTFELSPQVNLTEGTNFAISRSLPFTIGANPSILSFKIGPQFDTSDTDSINDAFEVALVDANGNSLVHTVAGGRDAFFNWTEGEQVVLGAGTTYNVTDRTVSLNLTGITPGTNATLIFRLVNNDSDTATNVKITDFAISDAPAGTQSPLGGAFATQFTSQASTTPNFNLLSDVSQSFAVEYHRTTLSADTRLLYADIAIQNIGSYSVDTPLIVAVKNISEPSVFVRQPDGFTPQGIPYYDFGKLVTDKKLDPDEETAKRSLIFYNPQGVQFTYELAVLAEVNAAPTITTNPNVEIIGGQQYHYDVNATDPNGDLLTYKLLVSPDGMTINSTTGLINWDTTVVGNQTIIVEVNDNCGGVTQQQYTIAVIDAPPNRPPVFISTPVVDAAINTLYTYHLVAQDADRDSLAFSLVNGPEGMTVDSTTGVVNWTPTGTQLGTYNVAFAVTDGRGGVAQQDFKVRTQAQAGNHAPIIVSEPITSAYISKTYIYDVNALDADNDSLTYSLVQAPEGMIIDSNTGIINWNIPVVGQQDVTVGVQDSRGGVDTQHFSLNVSNITSGVIAGQVYLDNSQSGSIVYFNDFENSNRSLNEWSNPITGVTPIGNRHFLGRYGGRAYEERFRQTRLTLDNLPEHEIVTLSFKLYVNDSWNGSTGIYSPDTWRLNVAGGQTLLYTTFGSGYPNGLPQAYPNNFDANNPYANLNPSGTGASETNTLGYYLTDLWGDAVYNLTFTFEHNGSDLAFDFIGGTDEDINNESWSLDDVQVSVNNFPKGLANWSIYLDGNNNGQHDLNELSTFTDDEGNYSFTVNPGNYNIVQEIQAGWTQTQPTTSKYQITLNSNQSINNLNFSNKTGVIENVAPTFLNTPPTQTMVGQKFSYRAAATDLNGDALSYELVVKPEGMVVDSKTGLVFWQPNAEQTGMQDVILKVSDGVGGVNLQSFQLQLLPFNQAPVFTNINNSFINNYEDLVAKVNRLINYQFSAIDPEGDSITYSLKQAPSGVTLDPINGILNWIPDSSQVRLNNLLITATDSKGAETTINFDIRVVNSLPNSNPVIVSTPRKNIALGQTYIYSVQANDSNHDSLTYSLETAPDGMTIDAQGRITWQPQPTQVDSHPVTIKVSDGRGGFATQTFNLDVVSTTYRSNSAPSITSTPNLVTNLERTYSYNLTGTDPDGDLLLWSLDSSPDGMVIDAQSGALRWQPSSIQIGEHTVAVRLSDAYGLYTGQEFTLTVTGVNTPPQIVSTPITRAAQNQAYTYTVVATDPENDALTFNLGSKPAGMSIDSNGTITWTPQSNQVDSQKVEVFVTDTQGATTSQTYTIEVGTIAINTAPSITSTPVFLASVGSAYSYQVQATDPDGDRLTYQLLSVPAGVTGITLDPTTGLLTWDSPVAGNYQIVVGAVDAAGLGAAQGFTLTARANNAPVIQSNPVMTATPGSVYAYDIIATDAEGDRLTYTLDQVSVSKGMTLDALGRLRWNPTTSNVGSHTVVLTVSDGNGGSQQQQYDLLVAADTEAPKVRLVANYDLVNLGESVIFQARATDNVRVAGLQLLVNGTPVVLDASGMATFKPTTAGTILAKVIATDTAGNVGQASFDVAVIDTSDVNAPSVSLDLGAYAGNLVTAPIDIKGSISDDGQLDYYKLLVAPIAGGEFKEILFVDNPSALANSVLGKFDPSLLQNDSYILRLEVADNGGNVSYAEEVVDVAGELKLGNFRLSFTDLTVPVTGIPITLTRTYDTLTSNTRDDFGYGWRMEFRDTDLRTSLKRDPDMEELGYYTAFKEGTRVYITLPGGKREAFTFKPKMVEQYDGVYLGIFTKYFYQPEFVADKGVTSTLSVESNFITLGKDTNQFYGFAGNAYNPEDPYFGGKYKLTTKEGIVYEIDAATGDLLTVTDNNGNKLTYTDEGIFSSTGKQITFERDAQGRIASVKDPMGELIRYGYDAKGDLVSVTDREGNTTRMEYNQERKHYLDKIIDPLNRTGIRNEYSDDGRLKEIIDVNGKAVEMTYDTNNSKQIVKDVRGYSTIYEYDQRGNILTEIDPVGKITKRTYDDDNNLKTETIITDETGADGYTTSYTYDTQRNQLTRTNPLNQTDYYTYNSFSQLLTSTNPLGYTTTYTYNSRGNVTSKTDAVGNKTTYTYYANGTPWTITEGTNDITKFEYDGFGNRTKKIDALGNEITYTYDLNGNQQTETKKLTTPTGVRTLVTTQTYDRSGKVKTILDAENGLTQYDYDANGNQILVVDALGRRTEMRYNEKNKLIETILPDDTPDSLLDNFRIKYDYDEAGNRTAITNQDKQATYYTYDPLNRPTGMILPDVTPDDLTDNPHITVEYNKAGQMKSLIQDGVITEFEYNAAGDITLTRNRQNGQVYEIKTVYDQAGRKVSTTDALNRTTKFVYDGLDRLVETIYADNTSTKTSYNAAGKILTQTDQSERVTRYEYDALDQLKAVIDTKQNRTEYNYDEAGNLTFQKDTNNNITRFEYDGLGRRIAVVRPMQQRSSSVYDKVGNIIETVDFNGDKIKYDYDENNRLITKHFLNENNRLVEYTYTATGQRDTVTDSRGVTDYDYDAQGRLISVTNLDNKNISYIYDLATGKLASLTTPDGTTSYRYNSLGQLEKVIAANGETTYAYDAVGNLEQMTLPNGNTQTYKYNKLNQLEVLESKDRNNNILAKYIYTYDKIGNTKLVEELDGRRVEFDYDELNRLIKETITDPVNGNRTIEYAYDSVGNRLNRKDSQTGETVYVYDNNDRLLSETLAGVTTTYTYDHNGNVITVEAPGQQVVYDWDSENNLIGANITTATETRQLAYKYNADGIRVASIIDGQETRYLIDANRPYAEVLEEYTPTGQTQVSYVHGLNLISQTRKGVSKFYFEDRHSGVRQLSNAAGAVTDTYNYDAYGNLLQSTGETQNNYLYRGEQVDTNLGMQYLRARYYNQNQGRFASVDPFEGVLEQPMTRHRYIYGNDNPVTYLDPGGEIAITLQNTALQNVLFNILATITGGIGVAAGISVFRDRYRNGYSWTGTINFGEVTLFNIDSGAGLANATSECADGFVTYGKYVVIGGGSSLGKLAGDPLSSITLPSKRTIEFQLRSPQAKGTNASVLAGSFGLGNFKYLIPEDESIQKYVSSGMIMGAGLGFAYSKSEQKTPVTNISGIVDVGFLGGLSILYKYQYAPCSKLPG